MSQYSERLENVMPSSHTPDEIKHEPDIGQTGKPYWSAEETYDNWRDLLNETSLDSWPETAVAIVSDPLLAYCEMRLFNNIRIAERIIEDGINRPSAVAEEFECELLEVRSAVASGAPLGSDFIG